jgi:hypothetical protein
MKNKIEDLRDHLFATLESLRDKENPMEVERAAAIANVAGKIIDSARAETERIRVLDAAGVLIEPGSGGFIQLESPKA